VRFRTATLRRRISLVFRPGRCSDQQGADCSWSFVHPERNRSELTILQLPNWKTQTRAKLHHRTKSWTTICYWLPAIWGCPFKTWPSLARQHLPWQCLWILQPRPRPRQLVLYARVPVGFRRPTYRRSKSLVRQPGALSRLQSRMAWASCTRPADFRLAKFSPIRSMTSIASGSGASSIARFSMRVRRADSSSRHCESSFEIAEKFSRSTRFASARPYPSPSPNQPCPRHAHRDRKWDHHWSIKISQCSSGRGHESKRKQLDKAPLLAG